jgi:hypothetical protein
MVFLIWLVLLLVVVSFLLLLQHSGAVRFASGIRAVVRLHAPKTSNQQSSELMSGMQQDSHGWTSRFAFV